MILRSKPVVNPTAMINNHVQSNQIPQAIETGIVAKLEKSKGILGVYYYLFLLLENSGCRFSEVQQIKAGEISTNGSVLIHGKKRSNDRVIRDDRVSAWLLACKSKNLDPFIRCNIWTANRFLKSLSIVTQKKGRERLTVSGIFREEFAKNIRSIQKDDATLTRSIGHKVKANDSYYGRG